MAQKQQQYLNRGWLGPSYAVTFTAFSAFAMYEFRVHTAMYGLDKRLNTIVDALQYPERADIEIRSHYTGIATLDYGLRFLVTVFLPSVAPFSEHLQAQLAYFLLSFFPIVAVFGVEATRRGNQGAWIAYTSVWALLYQSIGGAIIVPIWFLLLLRRSSQIQRYESSSVQIPLGYAKALLPAHILGYLLPTLVLFPPFRSHDLSITQALIANWQPSPIYVNIILVIIARVLGDGDKVAKSSESDVKYVDALYIFSFAVSVVAHVVLLYSSTQAQWSLGDIFIPRVSSLQGSVHELVYYIFQLDFAIIFTVAVLTAYITIMDMTTLGRASVSSLAAGGSLVLGTLLVGPGATFAAVWWWREGKIRLDKGNEKIRKGL